MSDEKTAANAEDERLRKIDELYERRAWALDEIDDIDRALRALGEEPVG